MKEEARATTRPLARAREEPSVPGNQRPGPGGLLSRALGTGRALLPGQPWDVRRVPLKVKCLLSSLPPSALVGLFPFLVPFPLLLSLCCLKEKESPEGGAAASASIAKPHLLSSCHPSHRSKERGRAGAGWGDTLHSFLQGLVDNPAFFPGILPQLLQYLHMERLSDLLVHVVGKCSQESFCHCLIHSLKDKRQREWVRLKQGIRERAHWG